jgi:N-acetylglucosamine kinase-like BadF-type ATPase
MKEAAYIGIDAGGSKILAVGSWGEIRKEISFPSVNARFEDPAQTATRLVEVVRRILSGLGNPGDFRVCVGLAGVASSNQQKVLQDLLGINLDISRHHILVVSDARVAFQAAFPNKDHNLRSKILVIAGTGSGCYSFGPDHEFYRTGGWGKGLGDPGSGTALGVCAIRHLLECLEGSTQTELSKAVWSELSSRSMAAHSENEPIQTSIAAILDCVYDPEFNFAKLAPILLSFLPATPLVSQLPIAQQLVVGECQALAAQVTRLASQISANNPLVALAGGLSENAEYLKILTKAIESSQGNATVIASTRKPVYGALELATELN